MKRQDMVGKSNPRWARDGRVRRGQLFGSWEVLSDEPFPKHGALYVLARCSCSTEREVSLRSLETGKSSQCKSCAVKDRHNRTGHLIVTDVRLRRLQKRTNDWFQRCNNPNSQSYRNYGARGIECRFESVAACVTYVLENLPHDTYLGVDIDRIDNDGHYEPGNLRLVSRAQNLCNTRRTTHVLWRGKQILLQDWVENPYALTTAGRYVAQGMTGEEILQRARRAVQEKRKGWMQIQERLNRSTTSSTVDPEPGSQPMD